MTGESEVWYRVEDRLSSGGSLDVHGEYVPGGSYVTVQVVKFPVIKNTPEGAWLRVGGERRFVLREARKRFAAPTVELALESFIARKTRQVGILEAQARNARRAIEIAKHGRRTETAFGGMFIV